jgi:hypothetical protein
MAYPRLLVRDLREYRGGKVDILVTSNTGASTSKLGPALAACPRPPLLVVMHTVPGVIAASKPHLRRSEPHITALFDIDHRREWLEMARAPGQRIPKGAKDIREAVRLFPGALQRMYPTPARPVSQPPAPGAPEPGVVPVRRPATAIPRAGPGPQRWGPPPGGGRTHIAYRGRQGG